MKKFLLTLMACLTISFTLPPEAHALTAKDLDGLCYGGFMRGMRHEATFPKEQFAGKFELRGSQLYMTNFWRAFDIPVTVSGNRITIPVSRYSDNGNGVWSNSTISLSTGKGYSYNGGWYIDYGYARSNSSVSIYLSTTSVDCEYCFATDNTAVNVSIYQGGQEIFADGNGLAIYVFKPNTTVAEYDGNQISDTYGASVEIDKSNPNFAVVKNWGNWGINFQNIVGSSNTYKLFWLEAEIDYDAEEFIIPRQVMGGGVNESDVDYLGHGYLHGFTANWYRWYGTTRSVDYYCASGTSGVGGDIIGKLSGREPEHHNVDDNHWHKTHGGQLETWHKMNIEFNGYQVYSPTFGTIGYSDKSIYETPYDYEYTHDAKLNLAWFAQDDTRFGFGGSVSGREKSRYIDSYDLYIMPGQHTSISDLTTHHDNGIEGAELIASGIKNMSRAAGEENAAVTIPDMVVNRPASIDLDPDRKYTLFLKANYNNGLHPTYHAMTMAADIPTGVGTIMEDGPVMVVRPVNGGVEVSGYDGLVEVYSVAGVRMFSGVADGLIELEQGTYIVRAAQRSWKVSVK